MSTFKQDMARMFPYLADHLQTRDGQLTLVDNGVPIAVVLTPDEWEGLELTAELMADPEALAEIRAAEEEYRAGDVVEDEEEMWKLIARRFSS